MVALHKKFICSYLLYGIKLTATTESRAATATISAQETTPGQTASTLVLMSSITSKPLKEFTFAPADFSPVKLEVSSNRTEASHPCTSCVLTNQFTNILLNFCMKSFKAKKVDEF